MPTDGQGVLGLSMGVSDAANTAGYCWLPFFTTLISTAAAPSTHKTQTWSQEVAISLSRGLQRSRVMPSEGGCVTTDPSCVAIFLEPSTSAQLAG